MTKEEVIRELEEAAEMLKHVGLRGFTHEVASLRCAISMLQNATIWTPCTERMPTKEDGDEDGDEVVNIRRPNGDFGVATIQNVVSYGLQGGWSWSRITPIERGEG